MINEDKLKELFESFGLYLENDEYEDVLDIDSFTFISLISAVEDEFGISIPDESLTFESLDSFFKILNCINSLV